MLGLRGVLAGCCIVAWAWRQCPGGLVHGRYPLPRPVSLSRQLAASQLVTSDGLALLPPERISELMGAFGDQLQPALMAYQGSWVADLFL